MKIKLKLLVFLYATTFGCYNPEEDLTNLRNTEFRMIDNQSEIIADGFSEYTFEIKLPGIKNGKPKSVSLNTTWGVWNNESSTIDFDIEYEPLADAYIEEIKLKGDRTIGSFSVRLLEDSTHIKTLKFVAEPSYPTNVQIISDSIKMRLLPGNTTQLKAFFFNEIGFPSDNIKFQFTTDADVNIFPSEVFLKSSQSEATLQISTETVSDTIKIYGIIPKQDMIQPSIDTLKLAIIN